MPLVSPTVAARAVRASIPVEAHLGPAPASAPGAPTKGFRCLDLLEKPIEWLIKLCGWSSIIAIVAIFLFIFREAGPMAPKLDWWHFFTSSRWIPNPAGENAA